MGPTPPTSSGAHSSKRQYSRAKQKVPSGCLPFHWWCKVSFLIRLLRVYCFNYAFLPWPLFLHISLKNSGVVSEVEKSKEIYVCHTWLIRRGKSLPATENPIKIYSWICSYPLWKENFFRRGFWRYPWPGQCLPGWSLFGRWPPLFCQRLMLSLPLPWQISLQIKHPLSQEGKKNKLSGDIKNPNGC